MVIARKPCPAKVTAKPNATAAVWFGTNRLFRRDVERLLHAVRERAAGRPTTLPIPEGELGQIARAVAQLDEAREALRRQVGDAEADRRDAEARTLGVLAVVSDAVIGISPSQQIALFNKGAERIFGYTAREAISQPLDLVLPALAGGRRLSTRELSPGSERWETIGRRKDGRQFPAAVWTFGRVPRRPAPPCGATEARCPSCSCSGR